MLRVAQGTWQAFANLGESRSSLQEWCRAVTPWTRVSASPEVLMLISYEPKACSAPLHLINQVVAAVQEAGGARDYACQ